MMNSDAKLDVIQWLVNLQDEKVWEKFISLKKEEEKRIDWWDELGEDEKKDIEEGLEGNSFSFEEVRAKIKDKHGI